MTTAQHKQAASNQISPWRLCVAPMLDWSDTHCRYLHRLLAPQVRLYSEMVSTGALLHGDVARHLRFNPEEQPLALQLGGSEPAELAACAKLGAQWGYAEINLNCGCPSPRVQRGAFGACLMLQASLVADGIKAMLDAVEVPVTVKHRLGVDRHESYDFVRDFVGCLSQAGCTTFIVHARAAWLNGLSPKDNRHIPPLRYDWVYRLKVDFPALTIVLNGGITSIEQVQDHLMQLDGVMIGRQAYQQPWWLGQCDAYVSQLQTARLPATVAKPALERLAVEEQMVRYMLQQQATYGTPWLSIARHMLGLRCGLPLARHWRQVWSDHRLKSLSPAEVMLLAHQPAPSQAESVS